MNSSKLVIIGILTLVAIIAIVVLGIIAVTGAMDLTDGCLYRYNFGNGSTITSADRVTNTVTVKADGNYTVDSTNSLVTNTDPNSYGKWVNTNLRLRKGQMVDFEIKGEVSLCRAYLPKYNLQSESDLNVKNERIPIPRIEEAGAPVAMWFAANTPEWRNIAQLNKEDQIRVFLLKSQKTSASTVAVFNSIEDGEVSADCREGQTSYHPLCGRFSVWSEPHTASCRYVAECYQCNERTECTQTGFFGNCVQTQTVYDWCSCYEDVLADSPLPYKNDDSLTIPWSDDFDQLMPVRRPDCRTQHTYIASAEYQNDKKRFWYTADNATGVLYRFDSAENPTNKTVRGTVYQFAKIQPNDTDIAIDPNYQLLFDTIFTQEDPRYLQYRFHDLDVYFGDNTGGYVFGIKQTKCRRSKGVGLSDSFEDRGVVQYIIAGYGENPNDTDLSANSDIIVADADGKGNINSGIREGYLWLRINNDPNDYAESFGQYQVNLMTDFKKHDFYSTILEPFFEGFKGKVKGAAELIFQKMTCSNGQGGDCVHFFSYIRAILILYITTYAMMFLLGMVQISQSDLVVRLAKIAVVAGLMNEQTFAFFTAYVFDFATGFSDAIIANMSGYSMFSDSTTISNPMMFMNEVMTKVFFSPTFLGQVLALFSMGINGLLYFIIIFISLGMVIIVLFRSLAVYIMAYMAVAVLIGISPLFLTFILFDKTRYLFDNWVKFTFRYMLEPVIVLAGVIILTQLFTIYLDYVLGYSICWKCAIPFRIPFPDIPGINAAFLDVDLFCLNWFAPWGFDHRSSSMGLNMQNMIILAMLAYCLWGYLDFAARIVGRIAGGAGGPSATSMGTAMAASGEQSVLKRAGLDAQSRAGIKAQADDRLKAMRKGGMLQPTANRFDLGKPTAVTSGGATGSGIKSAISGAAAATSSDNKAGWVKGAPSAAAKAARGATWQSASPSAAVKPQTASRNNIKDDKLISVEPDDKLISVEPPKPEPKDDKLISVEPESKPHDDKLISVEPTDSQKITKDAARPEKIVIGRGRKTVNTTNPAKGVDEKPINEQSQQSANQESLNQKPQITIGKGRRQKPKTDNSDDQGQE